MVLEWMGGGGVTGVETLGFCDIKENVFLGGKSKGVIKMMSPQYAEYMFSRYRG